MMVQEMESRKNPRKSGTLNDSPCKPSSGDGEFHPPAFTPLPNFKNRRIKNLRVMGLRSKTTAQGIKDPTMI
jgi:hypothetical protein